VTWRSLSHRRQSIVLTMARSSEPPTQTSTQAYMLYPLKSFDESLSDSAIAVQAGLMVECFTGAQALTTMLWESLSDSEKAGRKTILMIGLLGTSENSADKMLTQKLELIPMFFRTMSGASNGNVGVMRTMVSEIVQEKKAFSLFLICFNIGVIIGPILGGVLAQPAGSYPKLFEHIGFFKKFPYVAPSSLSALFLFCASMRIFLGLSEICLAHYSSSHPSLIFVDLRSLAVQRRLRHVQPLLTDVEMSPVTPITPVTPSSSKHAPQKSIPRWKHKLPFRRIFTYNVICTLISHILKAMHLGTSSNLCFEFPSTPVNDPKYPDPPSFVRKLPLTFTGGLGMPPRDIGLTMSILRVLGIMMQIFIHPIISTKLGTFKSWRLFLYCSPIAYILVPYQSIVPSKTWPPTEKDGILVWVSLCIVLFIQVTGRTFALPAMTILVNDACPHPSVLGRMHGIGQSFSSAGRTIGPSLGGALYGGTDDHDKGQHDGAD
ncbi:major facilitator superfamily domain-containing protein, partial [Calycina marina]